MSKGKSGRSAFTTEDAELSELLRPMQPAPVITAPTPIANQVLNDARYFHPDPSPLLDAFRDHPPLIRDRGRDLPRPFKSGVYGQSGGLTQTKGRLGFARPQTVSECQRRSTRREVLFSRRKTGKGSRAKTRQFTERSKFKC